MALAVCGGHEVWDTHSAGYHFLMVTRQLANETPLRDDKRFGAMKSGLGGRRNEVNVNSAKIFKNHLPQLVLLHVVPDLREHGINSLGK